jgi:small subunit ribosomal protein S8e
VKNKQAIAMVKWQGRSRTKPSGGRIWPSRKKRKREMGSEFVETKVGAAKRILHRVSGGGQKSKLLAADVANVTDPKTGQTKPAKIIRVIENPADPHFVRRNVLTKGAVIETELGRARITSRPGQIGTINAVLIEEPKPSEKPTGAATES